MTADGCGVRMRQSRERPPMMDGANISVGWIGHIPVENFAKELEKEKEKKHHKH